VCNKADLPTAQEWAGHTSIKTTQDYNHPTHEDLWSNYQKKQKQKEETSRWEKKIEDVMSFIEEVHKKEIQSMKVKLKRQ
jgi:hypothetical protein